MYKKCIYASSNVMSLGLLHQTTITLGRSHTFLTARFLCFMVCLVAW